MEQFPQPKRNHTLEDQITRFANRNIDESSDNHEKHLKQQEIAFENMGALSHLQNLDNLSTDLGPDVIDLIKENKQSYMEFLREEKKIEAKYRKEKEEFYNENFKDEVKRLNKLRRKYPLSPEKIPGYIKPGTMGLLFEIEKDDKPYVVKFYDRRENKKEIGDAEIMAMLRAEGVDNVSHLKGYSYQDGVYVMDYIEGRTLSEITLEEKPDLTDVEIRTIIGTTINLYKRGVVIDTNVRNFIFNDKNNVNIIDYSIEEGKLSSTMYYLRDLAIQLCERKESQRSANAQVNYSVQLEQITMLEKRMINIIKKDFPDFARIFKDDLTKWKNNV